MRNKFWEMFGRRFGGEPRMLNSFSFDNYLLNYLSQTNSFTPPSQRKLGFSFCGRLKLHVTSGAMRLPPHGPGTRRRVCSRLLERNRGGSGKEDLGLYQAFPNRRPSCLSPLEFLGHTSVLLTNLPLLTIERESKRKTKARPDRDLSILKAFLQKLLWSHQPEQRCLLNSYKCRFSPPLTVLSSRVRALYVTLYIPTRMTRYLRTGIMSFIPLYSPQHQAKHMVGRPSINVYWFDENHTSSAGQLT